MYKDIIDKYIDEHKEDILKDLVTLVKIDSQRQDPLPGMPYGKGPADVLRAAQDILDQYGFVTKNYDNYVVTGDFNDKEKKLDILAHLDVVPVTENWKETSPFEPVIKGDRIYGRGTADDKGPALAAIYALRAIRETGIDLKRGVRVILGSDEECGSSDLEHYYSLEQEAEMTFTPDAEFPVINIEKGRLARVFSKDAAGATGASVLQIKAGTKVNVVPDTAIALVTGMTREQIEAKANEMSDSVHYMVEEDGAHVRITAKGLAAHASTPELGHNAIAGLLSLLAALPLAECEITDAVKGLAELFPMDDFGGAAMGIAMEDEESGKLTLNLGVLNYDGKVIKGEFDSRVPICGTDETVTMVVAKAFEKIGMKMDVSPMTAPHCVPEDSELVKKLLASYETYFGIKGKALAIGGGTYVHELKRGVAFGCMIPEVDNHMHGDDEFMEISMLLKSAKIFADAIIRICNE